MWGLGKVVLCVVLASTISQAATQEINPESSIEDQRNLEPSKIEDPNNLEAKGLGLDLHNQEDPRSLELSSLEEFPKTLDPLNLEPQEALDILLSLDENLLENQRNLEGNPGDSMTKEESSFSMASLFNTPVASNLVSLIANAMRNKDQELGGQKTDDGGGGGASGGSLPSTSSSSPSSSSSSSPPSSPSSLVNLITTVVSAGEETQPPTSHTVEGADSFSPASVGQFGLPGTGSKLVDYLPDMSGYSIDATGLAPLAGASAVALLALGALFAVPVAPVILRRTGTSGWSGLPSLRELFNWWSSPGPAAEAWADKYHQRYDHSQQQQQQQQQHQQRPQQQEQQYQQRPQQQHQRPEHYYDTKNYHDEGEQYYNYDTSGSSSNTDSLYQDSNPQTGDDSSAHHPYHDEEPPNFATPAPHHNQPPSYAAAPQQPPARRRGPNRRRGVDGYEYVTLEQINRIGDDSIRLLGQLANGYNTEDLYAYRDGGNQLAHRRLAVQRNQQQANPHQNSPQTRPHQPNPQVRNAPHRYHPRPSYQDTQTYVQDEEQVDEHPYHDEQYANSPYREEHYDESTYGDEQYGEHPYRDETHEKHPYRDETHDQQPFREMFSMTEEKEARESEETPHPYRHKYNFGAAELSDNSDNVNTPQTHKVSDFPYEFHKAE